MQSTAACAWETVNLQIRKEVKNNLKILGDSIFISVIPRISGELLVFNI